MPVTSSLPRFPDGIDASLPPPPDVADRDGGDGGGGGWEASGVISLLEMLALVALIMFMDGAQSANFQTYLWTAAHRLDCVPVASANASAAARSTSDAVPACHASNTDGLHGR